MKGGGMKDGVVGEERKAGTVECRLLSCHQKEHQWQRVRWRWKERESGRAAVHC